AVNVVDTAVGRIIKACGEAGADLLITADHGNIEKMINDDGSPMTAHTTNKVPFYYIGDQSLKLREGGRLADIAPTMLKLLNIPQPDEMTGASLLV
ncbi:MAG TPA: 2,3-bisphosphoglycerate-independent phosphoglycerate mutase, partial [Nitrospirae bacterium]|nr:2,3-bisphosphoglycerate-independent phosphoglycerate mutase [Nitrospirota bacterium]